MKQNIYSEYKPLRNALRAYNLWGCLEDIWLLESHLTQQSPLPASFFAGVQRVKLSEFLFPWDLPMLQREIVLHASPGGSKRLNSMANIGDVMNKVRSLENTAVGQFLRKESSADHALASLHAVVHRQFPLQRRKTMQELVRHLKIYGEPEVDDVLHTVTGLTAKEWFFLGSAVSGALLSAPGINSDQSYERFGISRSKSQAFFDRISIDVVALRAKTQGTQRYDADWNTTWNPIESTPLVSVDPSRPHLLHCPIPELLLRRISSGLFYDLADHKHFSNPYGKSIEAYVGEVIEVCFKTRPHELLREKTYKANGNTKHGTDWVLTDPTGNLFIECKAKRLSRDAKRVFDRDVLQSQLNILANAVVQHYKNIDDAINGLTQWNSNGKPIYPVVVTWEDWVLFGPVVKRMLNDAVCTGLAEAGLSVSLVSQMPYAIMSASELEDVCGVWAEVGIAPFFDRRHRPECVEWLIRDVASSEFPQAWRNTASTVLFEDVLKDLILQDS